MKALFAIAVVALVGACASLPEQVLEEYYYIDREYGVAQQHSIDLQVLNPHAGENEALPEGLEGVSSEEVMSVHNSTFAEKPTAAPVLSLGIAED